MRKTKRDDFACRCSDKSRAEADEVMAWVLDHLSKKESSEIYARPITRENLATEVVVRLAWDYHASIDGIYCDQWSAISSSTYQPDKDKNPAFTTWIQCDQVEDGFAYTYKTYYDKFGMERKL